MLTLAEKNTILTLHKKGKSKTEIADTLCRNWRTVDRCIREDERLNRELLEQEEGSVEQHIIMEKIAQKPESKAKNKKKERKVWTPEVEKALEEILEDEKRKGKVYGDGHKIGRNAQDIYEELLDRGFQVSYSLVTLRLRERRRQKSSAVFIRQEYSPGERAEFDFGERTITIAGKRRKVHVAVMCSAYNNYRDFYVYPNQKTEAFVDAHVRFFKRTGVYRKVVYDNMKIVVRRFVGRSERELTETVLNLSNYYGFEIVLTNPRSGNEKGSVEVSVQRVCHDLFAKRDQFDSWEDLTRHVSEVKREMNKDIDIGAETAFLNTSKPPYESAAISERRVSKYSFVRDDKNDYSVPEAYVNVVVTVKRYPHTVEIFHKGKLIASHNRLEGENECSVDLRHYLGTMLRKPGALANSVALDQSPKLKQIFNDYYTDNPKEFLEIVMDSKDTMDIDGICQALTDFIRREPAAEEGGRIERESASQLASVSSLFKGGGNEQPH